MHSNYMLRKGGFMGKTVVKKQEQQAELQPKFVRVCGTVTDMMYGRRTYSNGRKDKEDKFRLSIKPADGEMDKLIKEAIPYYEDADANYIPKFLKDDASDEDLEYLNLKSSFEFPFAKLENGAIVEAGTFTNVLEQYGNITGSKVVVTVKLVEGAFYPASVCIVELKSKSFTDFYSDLEFDELPFA